MNILALSQKYNRYIVKSFFAFTLMFSLFGFTPQAQAGAWGESIYAMLTDNIMDTISRQIEGAMLGTLKVTAIQTLNSKISQLAGGSQPVFITDWPKFLYTTPEQQTNVYMRNFFQVSTRGKYSNANYTGFGETGESVSGNYSGYLVSQAEKNIYGSEGGTTYDLDQYGNPNTMFQEGDFRGINAFFKPANNPYGYSIIAQNAYLTELDRQKEVAKVQAQSSGFLGVQKNGITTTPAGSVQAMVTDVQTLGNKVLASAQNPAEFLSGVVLAVVNTTVNQVVQRGVGEVQSTIKREVEGVNNQIYKTINQASAAGGPAASLTNALIQQRINVDVNTNTPAPPSARKGL